MFRKPTTKTGPSYMTLSKLKKERGSKPDSRASSFSSRWWCGEHRGIGQRRFHRQLPAERIELILVRESLPRRQPLELKKHFRMLPELLDKHTLAYTPASPADHHRRFLFPKESAKQTHLSLPADKHDFLQQANVDFVQ